jgi:hypothetical protein
MAMKVSIRKLAVSKSLTIQETKVRVQVTTGISMQIDHQSQGNCVLQKPNRDDASLAREENFRIHAA